MLANFSVEQSLMKAKFHAKNGELAEAQELYLTILQNFSNNIRAQQGLATLNKCNQNSLIQSPPQKAIDQLVNLYNQGQLKSAFTQAQDLSHKHSNEFIVFNILGASAIQIGKLDEAIEAYKKCISLKPNYVDAYLNLGVAYKNQGKFDEAIEVYKTCILLKPNYAAAYENLGIAFKNKGDLDKAVEAYKKAILLKPDHANVYYNMGNVLSDQLKFKEAIEYYRKSISLKPNYVQAYHSMGNALKDKGELDEAINAYKNALLLKPDNHEIYNNLGITFHKMGKLEEAEANLKQTILLNPEFAEAHQNLSFTLLNNGKLKEGLDENEWRWKTKKFFPLNRQFSQSVWDGKQSLMGKRILLWCEQGIGDTLNFSSILPLVSSKAEHCILECPKKLVPLLKRSFPKIEVTPEDRSLDAQRNDFDFHLPMGSLYKHFLNEILQNPKLDAYLIPDPVRVNFWKKRLKSLGKGPYIGVCWKSSVVSAYRLQHYPPISEWSPVLGIPDVTFINLQYTDFADDLAKVKDELGVTVHNFEDLDQYNNVDDVVALCAALDMGVTTKVTPMIFTSGVGTPTKIVNWQQSIWNNILFNPVSSSVDMFERNTWEPWDNIFNLIAEDISKQKDSFNYSEVKL
jgi:tetratricopeptide (TPR) repeat protein